MDRNKERSNSSRPRFSDEEAVEILKGVKEFGRGEVVFSISDGEIRKAQEIKAHSKKY